MSFERRPPKYSHLTISVSNHNRTSHVLAPRTASRHLHTFLHNKDEANTSHRSLLRGRCFPAEPKPTNHSLRTQSAQPNSCLVKFWVSSTRKHLGSHHRVGQLVIFYIAFARSQPPWTLYSRQIWRQVHPTSAEDPAHMSTLSMTCQRRSLWLRHNCTPPNPDDSSIQDES